MGWSYDRNPYFHTQKNAPALRQGTPFPSVFAFARRFRFLLALHARLFIMLTLANFGNNARAGTLPLEPPQSTFEGFVLTNTDLRHRLSLPSAHKINQRLHAPAREHRLRDYTSCFPARQYCFRKNCGPENLCLSFWKRESNTSHARLRFAKRLPLRKLYTEDLS